MNAKIVKKEGFGVRNAIHFEWESINPITPEMAVEAQKKLGYIAQGYGFNNFKVNLDPVLFRYKATWSCSGSCD